MASTLSARQLNRATLGRQLLLERAPLDVVEAVRRIVALQAQEPASPYLALWARLQPFDPAELDRAFTSLELVKASLLRITLHAVTADDYPAFHRAMQPTLRAARYMDRRFTNEDVSVEEAEALVSDLRTLLRAPRTNRDAEAWLEERFGSPKPRVWWALRHVGPFVHAPVDGTWSFGSRPAYTASPTEERPDAEAAVRTLVRRYLEGFGPASFQDIAQFGTLYRPPIRDALRSMEGELVEFEGPTGISLYDVPDGLLPAEDTAAPARLLPMWDSVLLAYADRSRIVPPEYRTVVMRNNGDVLPTLLVDGCVAGVWRAIDDGIEATAFRPLPAEAWDALQVEALSLRALLAPRDPLVYRRYGHWWKDLPAAEVRRLGT